MNSPLIDDSNHHDHPLKPREAALSQETGESGQKDLGKIVRKKERSLLAMRRQEREGNKCHVHDLHSIIAVNFGALGNPQFGESYFKTLFYQQTIERVELRKQALIIHLRPLQLSSSHSLSPQQLIQSLFLQGQTSSLDLAASLSSTLTKLAPASFSRDLMASFDGEPLSRFIDSMDGRAYLCKAEPNKLVLSRALLQLLGQDAENYAVQLVKYRMPMREIMSAESYPMVINQLVQNLGGMCDYIKGEITASELHARSSLMFTDSLLTRTQNKLKCNILLYMPTPQMTCFHFTDLLSEDDALPPCPASLPLVKQQSLYCDHIRLDEAQTLSRITRIPEGLLRRGIPRMAGYKSF